MNMMITVMMVMWFVGRSAVRAHHIEKGYRTCVIGGSTRSCVRLTQLFCFKIILHHVTSATFRAVCYRKNGIALNNDVGPLQFLLKKRKLNLRQKRSEDYTHNWIVIERDLLHFANGSQKTSSSVDSSGMQRSLQGFEDGVLIFTNFSIKKKISILNLPSSYFHEWIWFNLDERVFFFLNEKFFKLDNDAKDQGKYVDV